MPSDLQGKNCIILMATHNDWPSIMHLLPEIDKVLSRLQANGRVIIVDDSSSDVTGRDSISSLPLRAIKFVDEIQLGSNQGNQRALAIGVSHIARNHVCDYLVVMDSDNEDKPEDIEPLLEACQKAGSKEIIFAHRAKRSESSVFKISYFLFRKIFKFVTGESISFGNFCAIPGHMIKRLAHISGLWNHFSSSILRSGLPNAMIPTERGTRLFQQRKMNLIRLIIHAFNGFSIHADVISVRILLFISSLILLFIAAATVLASVQLHSSFFIPGWTSQMLMQIFALSSTVFFLVLVFLILLLSLRILTPMIPYHDSVRFILEIYQLYPASPSKSRPS